MSQTLYKMTEREWSAMFEDICRLYRWDYYHTHDSRNSVGGFPDYVLVRRPRIEFVELKTDKRGSKLSDKQVHWAALLGFVADANQTMGVRVWRPSDYDEVIEVLK